MKLSTLVSFFSSKQAIASKRHQLAKCAMHQAVQGKAIFESLENRLLMNAITEVHEYVWNDQGNHNFFAIGNWQVAGGGGNAPLAPINGTQTTVGADTITHYFKLTIDANATLVLNADEKAVSSLTISSGAVTLNLNGNDLIISDVGDTGALTVSGDANDTTGSLTITNSSIIDGLLTAYKVDLGTGAGAKGALTVSGSKTTLKNLTSVFSIGNAAGGGSLTVSDGAKVNTDRIKLSGLSEAKSAKVTVGANSSLTVATTLQMSLASTYSELTVDGGSLTTESEAIIEHTLTASSTLTISESKCDSYRFADYVGRPRRKAA